MVLAISYRLMGSYEDALDIAQEVFLKVYRSLKGFSGRAKFSTWLYRITVNTCYKRLKNKARLILSRAIPIDSPLETEEGEMKIEPADEHTPRLEAIKEETCLLIREALKGLDKEHYEVIALKELQGLSYKEIAEELNLPMGTVMSRLHRAKAALGKKLKELGLE